MNFRIDILTLQLFIAVVEEQSIAKAAERKHIAVSAVSLNPSSVTGGSGNAGGPGDTVTVSLTSNVKLMTPVVATFFSNGVCRLTFSSTYRNEPFPPSQTT